MAILDEAVVLNDGSLMPKIGVIGTNDAELAKAVKMGYRLLACPADKNLDLTKVSPQLYVEIEISEEIKTREELRNSFKIIRNNLVKNHADLCLLKLSDDLKRNDEVWQELEQLKIKGWVKTLGVIRANADELTDILQKAQVKPSVVETEIEDQGVIALARKNKMQVEVPVHGDIEALTELAENYKTMPVELVLRYFNQKSIIPLIEAGDAVKNPKTDFVIKGADMSTIGQLFSGK